MSELDLFHFLRPLWLLALPIIVLTWWLVKKHESQKSQVASMVAPHLRDALTINRERKRAFRPVDGIGIALTAAALAAAGPTWGKQPSPWFAETAPLVIAIEVSDSMRANDLQPTRLDRARFKILDLIEQRTGSSTALIAYAGSAHILMPPTKDINVVKPFLESLDPAIMPQPGAAAQTVLPLSRELLGADSVMGTLLFVNDGFDRLDIPDLVEFSQQPEAPSMAALIVGTDQGGVAYMPDGSPVLDPAGGRLETAVDGATLRRVESEAAVSVVRASNDDKDIRRLLRQIESNLQQADDPNAQWQDQGWPLIWPATILVLFWFRRGWTMRW